MQSKLLSFLLIALVLSTSTASAGEIDLSAWKKIPVFEAKNKKLSRPEALRELDRAREERSADFAVLVVAGEGKVPAKMLPLREYNGDKMVVTFDPEDGPLSLQVAYSLARARVLMAKGGADGLDASALRAEVERATVAMEDVRKIKSQLTSAANQIEDVRKTVEVMADRVRGHLGQIDAMVAAASETDDEDD